MKNLEITSFIKEKEKTQNPSPSFEEFKNSLSEFSSWYGVVEYLNGTIAPPTWSKYSSQQEWIDECLSKGMEIHSFRIDGKTIRKGEEGFEELLKKFDSNEKNE